MAASQLEAEHAWVPGRRARLIGLIGRAELNDTEVVVLSFIPTSGRWATRCVCSGEQLAVRGTNLQPSASLLEVLGADELVSILMCIALPDLAVIMQVSHQLSERARYMARTARWQLRHATLMDLVQGGADASTIRDKHHSHIYETVGAGTRVLATNELMDCARHLVQSGAAAENLHALLELPPDPAITADVHEGYRSALCMLRRWGLEDESLEGGLETIVTDEEGRVEAMVTLLHHAAICGAGLGVVSMILEANPMVTLIPDPDSFLPMHYAAAYGSSPQVMRMLIQVTLAVDPHTQALEEAYDASGGGGTLLHLALQGGSCAWDFEQRGPPMSASQNAVAMMLLTELVTLAPPPPDWDHFVPPEQTRLIDPPWSPPLRYPLHLAALAGATEPLIAALVAAYPPAARLRDATPGDLDLAQPYGYLPMHYALGAARTSAYEGSRACAADAQATLLAAYPFEEWPLIDLLRAGPSALAEPAVEALVLAHISNLTDDECTEWYLPNGGKVESDLFLHLAVGHAAPPRVLSALLRRRPAHAAIHTISRVKVLPLHLARTAAAVAVLLRQHPAGARQKSKGKEPHCEPLAYALRNKAPVEVVSALTQHHRECGLDAFGIETLRLGRTHTMARKMNGVDKRRMWKGFDARGLGLRRLFGGDRAAEEGASRLLSTIIEEGSDLEAVRALLHELAANGETADHVSRGARPWGCECPNAGGCARCIGRRLPGGWTPLHEACCQGRADLVALLLEAKADATCTTYKRRMGGGGTTPLAVALDQEHAACAALLERSSTSNVECP
jgi:hypothetical protein